MKQRFRIRGIQILAALTLGTLVPPVIKEIPFRGLFGVVAVPLAVVMLFLTSLVVFWILFALPLAALEFLQKSLGDEEPIDIARLFKKELPLFSMIAVLLGQSLLFVKGVAEPVVFVLLSFATS